MTGGAGFVGSWLVEALLARGCHVTVIDDFSSGDERNLPRSESRLSVLTARIGAPSSRAIVQDTIEGAALVFHLASPIGVARAHNSRYEVTKDILDAGSMVADVCRSLRCPLVYTSSSEVYGSGRAGLISEGDPVMSDLRPRWGYAVAKAAIEHMVAGLFFEFGIDAWVVRPFNMTGARQRPETGLVVPVFVDAALRGEPVVVHGDGSQTRAFLHVADAVDALLLIAACPELRGRPVNLGGVHPWHIGDLARFVVEATGARSSFIHRPHEDLYGNSFAAAHDRLPDTSLLTTMTGWKPKRSMQQAVLDCATHLEGKAACRV